MERENKTLEYKENVSNTFLKTVSAFANYGDGTIIFGITDTGEIKGIANPVQTCLDIENRINDSISPIPAYELAVNRERNTITLTVRQGMDTPYVYKNKAYKRNDSATIEVNRLEFNRLVLAGMHQNMEDLPASHQNLTFSALEAALTERIHLKKCTDDVLRTLGLYDGQQRFTNVAEWVSDQNSFPGIDCIRFGKSIDEIMERKTLQGMSVLSQFYNMMDFFKAHYTYEKISGIERTKVEMIPENAFREALANSIVHRMWDVPTAIHISMYTDKIEISSPGGLPAGITVDEYLYHQISVLRNPKLANIFYRLGYIESFGTGVQRMIHAYDGSSNEPAFLITNQAIKITLPLLQAVPALRVDERTVYDAFPEHTILSRKEVEEQTRFDKSKLIRLLNQLVEKGLIRKIGNGRGTKYTRT